MFFFGGVSRPLLQLCTQMKGTVAYVWNVGSAFFVLKRSTRNSLSQPVWLYIMASQASHPIWLTFCIWKVMASRWRLEPFWVPKVPQSSQRFPKVPLRFPKVPQSSQTESLGFPRVPPHPLEHSPMSGSHLTELQQRVGEVYRGWEKGTTTQVD